MPKNILHDIMTREKRTIRHVPLPRGKRGAAEEEELLVYEQEESVIEAPAGGGGLRRFLLWGVAFVFLILLGFALATGFSGATVIVTPKTALIEVNHEFVASKGSSARLRFQTLTLAETAELSIPADTTKQVTVKATGRIVVYNAFSEKPQRLIKNTRFATAAGLIYRIAESIVIPGLKREGGKVVPGSIEATVFADAAGAEYNVGLTDFSVPGFKTDKARYAAFYARSKTPISGGQDGMMRAPSDESLRSARAKLALDLEASVREKAALSVPDGFILFDQALVITTEAHPPEVTGGTAKVRSSASGAGYLLERAGLERAVAKEALRAQAELSVTLPDVGTLRFEWSEKPAGAGTAESLRFKLRGGIRAIWQFDKEKLEAALLGRQKSDLAVTLSSFPTIEKVDLVLRPFWSRSFPTNPEKVVVEEASLEPPSAVTKEE